MNNLIHSIFDGKRTIILGFGREGKESFNLISKYIPSELLTIADQNDSSIPEHIKQQYRCITGPDYLENINDFDIIVKSPGISEHFMEGIPEDKITSQTDIFLQQYHNRVIGITGTKGKSTTSSLIAHMLTTAGIKNVLVGNIGIPAFSALNSIDDETVIVMELSAHQLNHIKTAPHIALFLNIREEHLDHFGTFEQYFKAKCNIFTKQGKNDILIIDRREKEITDRILNSPTSVVSHIESINIENTKDMQTQLRGQHNKTNLAFAAEAVSHFNIPREIIEEGARSFTPLPHRLQYVGTYSGIEFYNDSISTIPDSAMAAMSALGNVGTIILGGFDRGISYKKFAKHLAKCNGLNIIATGDAGKRICELVKEQNYNCNIFYAANMKEIIELAFEHTPKDTKCLLSPAASSYDQYKNFEERGRYYVTCIHDYVETH